MVLPFAKLSTLVSVCPTHASYNLAAHICDPYLSAKPDTNAVLHTYGATMA